jgi:hypothetical protein
MTDHHPSQAQVSVDLRFYSSRTVAYFLNCCIYPHHQQNPHQIRHPEEVEEEPALEEEVEELLVQEVVQDLEIYSGACILLKLCRSHLGFSGGVPKLKSVSSKTLSQ